MAKFLVRRFVFLLFTMLFVSMIIFAISELAPGDVVRHMLGAFATPEQEESLREQLGLNRPVWTRYVSWLVGSDLLWARPKVGMPLRQTVSPETGFAEWWAREPDGTLIRWRLEGEDLIAMRRQPDGTIVESVDNGRWRVDAAAEVERLKEFREEVIFDPQLSLEDRYDILQEADHLVEILSSEGLTREELLAQIKAAEQALEVVEDAEAAEQRKALRTAARGMLKNEVVVALTVARELSETSGTPDEEYLRTVPNQLGKAASLLAKTRPELAEGLRQASKSLLTRDLDGARATLAETVDPLSDLIRPLTDLAQALEGDNYLQAAAVFESMFDPSGTPDEALMAIMSDQFKDTARALKDLAPELAEDLSQASESLKSGDAAAAHEAFGRVTEFLTERGPVIARNEAVRKAKVGRFFWGVDNLNHAVLWQTGGEHTFWMKAKGAGWWVEQAGGAVQYIPLQRGLLRGDPGESVRTRQPVSEELVRRVRNSVILAGLAFVVVMPLALLMGLIAGLNEGKPIDRVLSIFGLVTTASPNFATGVFLILIFSVWLKLLPGATVFTSSTAIFEEPKMLVLPVATLTLIELGYVLRMTRASMVEVMKTGYIRTAILKGLPYRRIVFKHAVRNALMAPITVIMLHVNWLMGGIVVVEAIFGFPGLGNYLLQSALYKDVFAIEAGAMVMVILAVGTQLVADVIYTFLNPRIRYA
jgi:peptide/nickel transport system permease protein